MWFNIIGTVLLNSSLGGKSLFLPLSLSYKPLPVYHFMPLPCPFPIFVFYEICNENCLNFIFDWQHQILCFFFFCKLNWINSNAKVLLTNYYSYEWIRIKIKYYLNKSDIRKKNNFWKIFCWFPCLNFNCKLTNNW